MKTFVITKNDSEQRLDKFLSKSLPNLPSSLMYKYIRKKRIKINGKKAEISTKLNIGDKLDLYINDEFFEKKECALDFLNAPEKLDILYEDNNIILLDKKVGLLCHADNKEYIDTLISRIKKYLYEKGEYNPDSENSFTPSLVNRIDRNTGGIVIAAKNSEALRILNAQLKARNIKKNYICVVHGIMPEKSQALSAFLIKDESKNTVKVYNKKIESAKEIKTKYTVLDVDKGNNISLLDIELLTGRTHQIRAHLACEGHPLVGDGKYGTNKLNKEFGYKKQLLYSYKLRFEMDENAAPLAYLNGKEFEITNVWFKDAFCKRAL